MDHTWTESFYQETDAAKRFDILKENTGKEKTPADVYREELWIARYGEELVQSGFPESWTILRGRLEADVALWLRLRQGVLIAGAVSGAGVLVWTLLHWKKRRPPLAEEGET